MYSHIFPYTRVDTASHRTPVQTFFFFPPENKGVLLSSSSRERDAAPPHNRRFRVSSPDAASPTDDLSLENSDCFPAPGRQVFSFIRDMSFGFDDLFSCRQCDCTLFDAKCGSGHQTFPDGLPPPARNFFFFRKCSSTPRPGVFASYCVSVLTHFTPHMQYPPIFALFRPREILSMTEISSSMRNMSLLFSIWPELTI